MISAVLAILFLSSVTSLQCKYKDRERVQWYFDPAHWTCFAIPADCESNVRVDFKIYDSEEECTLKNMVRLWKTYSLSCGPAQRMAVYKRTNGDYFPYIFSSALCHPDSTSDICNKDESCHSHAGFAYCCKNAAFVGDGPVRGVFNFTGLGGSNSFLAHKSSTEAPPVAPEDCNLDGNRQEIEWYPKTGMMCLSRRRICSKPQFGRDAAASTYKTQQECMDAHYANWKISYRLTCSPGYSAVTSGTPIIFSKDKCGSLHNSDVCNRDEYCAFKNSSPYAFCCQRSSNPYTISYNVYGKNYRRRARRNSEMIVI